MQHCARRDGSAWKTAREEAMTYFGFQILMGIVEEPELRDYWSRNKRLHYAAISTRISRDRFEELTRYIHFVDNNTLPKSYVTTVEWRMKNGGINNMCVTMATQSYREHNQDLKNSPRKMAKYKRTIIFL